MQRPAQRPRGRVYFGLNSPLRHSVSHAPDLALTCTRRWPSRLVSIGLEPSAQFRHVVWVCGEDEGAEALGHHGHVGVDHI